ncbi:MAG: hypothetical protein M0R06_06315 [Sphaerochaeta sp.]|jgi:hypothetical protein|nr:hypothetical protein [Sphaerochaeta sp.]
MPIRNDIIPLTRLPDEVIDALVRLRDQIDRSSWQIGAIANLVYQWGKSAQAPGGGRYDVQKLQVYSLIGRVIGKSGRTVRWYAETEQFYRGANSAHLRRDYQVLPYSHFAFARRFGREAELVLERAAALTEEQGYPPSIERLEAEFLDRLKELRAAEDVGAALFGEEPAAPSADEEGAEAPQDIGAALIALVDEGLIELGFRAPEPEPESAAEPAPEPKPNPVNSHAIELTGPEVEMLIAQLSVMGQQLSGIADKIVNDVNFSRARGVPREARELSSRVGNFAKWLRRVHNRMG